MLLSSGLDLIKSHFQCPKRKL